MDSQASYVQLAKSSEGRVPVRFLDPTSAYNLWSEVYDIDGNFLQALDTIEMRTLLPKVLSCISSSPPWKIVDLGCGTGRNMARLLDIPASTVIGLDASPKMLEIARSRIDKHMAQISKGTEAAQTAQLKQYNLLGSDHIPPFALNADALISTLVLEHVPLPTFFEKASQILKPNGIALVTNMHSDMGAISQAGFVDPKTGEKVRTQSFAHLLHDVIAEAQKQGFEVVGDILERAVDEEMSEVLGHVFFYGIFVPVTPTALIQRAGVPPKDLQKWNSILLAVYGGATLAISPAAGFFMDRMESRRAPFLLCLICLTGATALLAVGTNVGLWVTGRLLQGVSAGMLWVVCLALLTGTVGPAGLGQAVGVIGIPMSIGPIVGPLLGGVIYAHGGYYVVFGLMFAMLGVDAVLRLAMIEKRVAQKWLEGEAVQPDTPNVFPKTDSPASPTPCPESFDTSNTMIGNGDETTNEARPSSKSLHHQLPPTPRLLLSFRMFVGLAGGLLQSSLNVAFDSTLPLVVNALFRWQQTGQGLIFITILLPSLLQPIFGAVTDRYRQGRRMLAAGGCLLATPAYVLLRFVTQDTLAQKTLLCGLLVVIGLAMAIAMPAIIAEIGAIVADAEKNDRQAIKGSVIATGWSLVNAAYAAGCLIGPLFAGLIRNAAGWQTTTLCLGLLSAVTGVFLLLCLGGWIGKLRPKALIHRVPT